MNTDLANKLRDTISRNMLTGDKKNMTREIRDLFDSTINRAKTIARTETARAYAVGNYTGAIEAKKRGHNIKKYWQPVLDDRTSSLCRRLGNKYGKDNAIDIEKEFIDPKGEWRGVANPAHPNCRSDVIYFIE
jgi:SPP1 gp7 family putative phage head morphogenesis protein